MIMMGGPPGVGKSTIGDLFLLSVMAATLPENQLDDFERNHNDYMYNRCVETEYFDGYHNQPIIKYDDAFQMKDSPGGLTNEVMEIIRLVNANNYQVHMSHLEDKGQTNAKPLLIFGTTNQHKFKPESIVSVDALIRRIHIPVWCVPRPEFCVSVNPSESGQALRERRLDERKLGDLTQYEAGVRLDIYEFFEWDFKAGEPKGPKYSYDELFDIVERQIVNRRSRGERTISSLDSVKRKFIAKRRERDELLYKNHPQALDSTIPQWISDRICVPFEQVEKFLIDNNIETLEKAKEYGLKKIKQKCNPCQGLDWKGILSGFYSSIWVKLVDNKEIIAAASMAGTALVFWHMFKNAITADSSTTTVRGKPLNWKRGPNRFEVDSNGRTGYDSLAERFGTQMNMQQQGLIQSIYKASMYHVLHDDKESPMGYMLFIKGTIAITTGHIWSTIQHDADENRRSRTGFYLRRCSAPEIKLYFDPLMEDVVFDANPDNGNLMTDIAMVKFPKDLIHAHKDIFKHFTDEAVLNKTRYCLITDADKRLFALDTNVVVSPIRYHEEIDEQQLIGYPIATTVGTCGAPLIFSDVGDSGHIIGLHVAGNGTSHGFSVRVSKKCVETLMSNLLRENEVVIQCDSRYVDTPNCIGGNVVSMELKQQPFVQSLSNLRKSLLHNVIAESKFAPASLRPCVSGGIQYDPWLIASRKYSRAQPFIEIDVLNFFSASVVKYMLDHSSQGAPWSPRLMSFEEAAEGIPGVPHCEAVPRSTSPGYPFVLSKKGVGKTAFFGKDGAFKFSSPACKKLELDVELIIESAKKGIRREHIVADCLKDERRKHKKVLTAETRKFSPTPLDYMLACRMYFMDAVRHIMHNRLENFCAIGVNPYTDWGIIKTKLLSKSDLVFDGDFKCFDGSLPSAFMFQFLAYCRAYYAGCPEEDNIVREVLFQDVCNSRHLIKGVVYEHVGGNPSGHFLTTVVNSFSNILTFVYTAWTENRDIPYIDFPEIFFANTYFLDFGDDNLISVSRAFADRVNQIVMCRGFKTIGMTYTPADKTSTVTPFRDFKKVTFLKRHFADGPGGTTLAPLDLDVILEMVQWTKKSQTDAEFLEVVDASIRELALHTPQVWETYHPLIANAVMDKYGAHISAYSQKDWREIILHTDASYSTTIKK